MITSKTLYEIYNSYYGTKCSELQKEIKAIETGCNRVIKALNPYLDRLEKILDYSLFLSGKVKTLKGECITQQDKFIKLQVELYYKLFSSLPDKNRELEKIKYSLLNYNIFRFILKEFNEELLDEMIYNKYEFEQSNIGRLCVVQNNNKKSYIDWGKSKQNKAKLIEEGKTPYLKNEAKQAEEEGRNYDGVKWLETYTKNNYLYLAWNPNALQANASIPNLINYSFVASYTKRVTGDSTINRLLKHRETLTDNELKLYRPHA